MRKNIKIITLLIKQKLIRQMMHRQVFWGGLFVNLSLFTVQLLFFAIIYSNILLLSGWSQYQMLFFIGTYNLVTNICMMFFYFGVTSIPRHVRSGKMDYYLLKPCKSLLYISFENFDLSSFPMVLFSIMIVLYSLIIGELYISLINVVLYFYAFLLMCILYYDLLVLVRCISFFTINIAGLEKIEWSLTELTMKVPGTAFKSVYKVLFCFIIPYGLISTIPSSFFFNGIDWKMMTVTTCLTLFFTLMVYFAWLFSLKHYRSASS